MLYTESTHYFFTAFFFIFGSLLGSFSNVVVLRMAISRSVIFPPSACPKCNHQLHAIDLVPIFSWLFLRGKCRYCKAPISIQYPLVESFMAILICLSFFKTGPSLNFICLASGMAIWFVASTIFIRNEVLKYQPFVWAVVYSIGLKYLIAGNSMFNIDFALITGLAIFIGLIAYIRNNLIELTRWACLSFLPLLYLPAKTYPYVVAVFLLLASCNITRINKKAKWAFYIVQLLTILLCLYFQKTNLLFIEYID